MTSPPPLVSIPIGTTPTPRDLPTSANTTTVGMALMMAAALAFIRPDDVAASDADI